MIKTIRTFAEAQAIVRKHGVTGRTHPAGTWPEYSPAEQEALEQFRREQGRLEQLNRWALGHLAAETVHCDPAEYLPRWRELGSMLRRAHGRYIAAEQEALAKLDADVRPARDCESGWPANESLGETA